MFNEHPLSTSSEPKTFTSHLKEPAAWSQRSYRLEPPNVTDSIAQDGCGLFKGWPLYHGPLQGSQFGEIPKAPAYHSKEAAIPADTMMEILKDLSESLEEVCSIASGERSTCSPSRKAFPQVEEPKTQTGPSSNANHEIAEIHELFESCAETITNLLDLVDPRQPHDADVK